MRTHSAAKEENIRLANSKFVIIQKGLVCKRCKQSNIY